ncbi:putative porin [Limnovirga soli]|uniref:Beta-barrel porin n=1 Tax=Limnovirga soli TaxID=2656915 RepID=A0A8J8FBI6_9BACT|nr:putative porin [Limnovirga soli]NNV54975.1 hypothetical protein [Limnovirga soli]
MAKNFLVYILLVALVFVGSTKAGAQINDNGGYNNSNSSGSPLNSRLRPTAKTDSANNKLQHRDALADSITISYHFFDSTKTYKLDSTVNDFYSRYPVPWYYTDLGNFGNATRSMIFTPFMKAGWDAGFHSYDQYRYTIENTKLYTTTRPYTELGYMLGSKSEQMINITHTQNRKSNINFGFDYRLINAPGAFKNQNTSHNNIRLNVAFISPNKRYAGNVIYISNKLRSAENGGIQDDSKLSGLSFNDPYGIPTRLGNASSFSRNFFSTLIKTGTAYDETILLFRHNYDLGQKDSLVTDSVTYKLFYPRLRFQHTMEFRKLNYVFQDYYPVDSLYSKYYQFTRLTDTISFRDSWKTLSNDFSIISFPQKNNLNQFFKAGAGYEMIAGGYYPYNTTYSNIYVAAEYRNRTRNKKWDVAASGKFYSAGNYAGDYEALLILERLLDKNKGGMRLGFQNVNRSESAIFSPGETSFPVQPSGNFGKQNIARAFANINLASLKVNLTGDYYIVSNYIYLDNYFTAKQQSALFNVLHIGAEKQIKLSKHWNWYIDAHVQQKTGDAPVNLPFLLTRNRFAFEGNFFTNLFMSTGFEVSYHTAYKADNYSPLNGQFFLQNEFSTANNTPDVNAFLHIRIKSFKGFLRVENINTLNRNDKYRFTNNNFEAPHFPHRSMWLHIGIWWNFVN